MDTLTRDTVSVYSASDLNKLTLEELRECHQNWLARGRETFNDLVLIAKELGEEFTQNSRAYKQFVYSFENEFSRVYHATITLYSSTGTFLPAEKEFSHTNSVSVKVKFKEGETQVCYLVDTNDPNYKVHTEYYIPGYWEYALPQHIAKARQHILDQEAGGREKARQDLLKLLNKGGV